MKSKTQQLSARDILSLNLKHLRQSRGWSQEELAFEAGLHRTFVAHVERKVRNISLDNIELLARALGVEVAELLAVQKVDKSIRVEVEKV